MLDLAGQPSGGAGGSTSTSTSPSSSTSSGGGGTGTSTTTSGSTGTGGAAPLCDSGMMSSCYDGPPGTADIGVCKSGMHVCLPDGKSYGACTTQTLPSAENCLDPADEDCDGKALGCTGATLKGATVGLGATDEVIFAVATDLAGDLFIGGVNGANAPSGQGFAMNSGVGIVAQILPNGMSGWSVPMTSAGASSYSVVRGLAADKKGNVYVVGELQGTATIGGVSVAGAGAGGIDVFLAKLDSTGKPLWAKAFGNAADQYGYGVAVDGADNVFITGRTVGAVDFGGGAPGVSAGAIDDIFVAKYDPLGAHLWSRAIGDDNLQAGYSVATTPEGDVVVAGSLEGTVDFGGGITLKSPGGSDVFVAKLASAKGATLWANRYGDDKDQAANSVAVGSDGGVVLAGSISGHCNFGGMDFDAHGSMNVFIAKLHSDGSHDWSHSYGSDNENQVAFSVAVDPALNIVAAGYLKGALTFGPTTLTDISTGMNTDLFVAKLSATGNPVWAYRFGDSKDETAWAVTTDSVSSVFVGGTYNGTLNLPPSLTAVGGYDAFWAKLAP
jgi:hypothetical protein